MDKQNFRVGDYIVYELAGIEYVGKILEIRNGRADIEICLTQKKSEKIMATIMQDVKLEELKMRNLL